MMTQGNSMTALTGIVKILTPLPSDERIRVVRAAMALLGEAQTTMEVNAEGPIGNLGNLPPRARAWMKQNSITPDQLQQVFHLSEGVADVIAPQLPGKNNKEQTYSAYIIVGIGQLLLTGNAFFDDKTARALCEKSGCYDIANHSAHLKDRGNEFAGTKAKGWTLTAPGLKRAAEIIKEMNKPNV
jgi:hypothetical protein